jgi:hypothetical protein
MTLVLLIAAPFLIAEQKTVVFPEKCGTIKQSMSIFGYDECLGGICNG